MIHLNHHLGVESWCIKYIYEYAHRMILNHKKNYNKCNNNSIVKYLNSAILINPDVSTFWNIRRNLVEKLQLNVALEFQFSAIVLSKKPKSNEAFFYRRWLYSFESEYNDPTSKIHLESSPHTLEKIRPLNTQIKIDSFIKLNSAKSEIKAKIIKINSHFYFLSLEILEIDCANCFLLN